MTPPDTDQSRSSLSLIQKLLELILLSPLQKLQRRRVDHLEVLPSFTIPPDTAQLRNSLSLTQKSLELILVSTLKKSQLLKQLQLKRLPLLVSQRRLPSSTQRLLRLTPPFTTTKDLMLKRNHLPPPQAAPLLLSQRRLPSLTLKSLRPTPLSTMGKLYERSFDLIGFRRY
jgi:hypothetical protein